MIRWQIAFARRPYMRAFTVRGVTWKTVSRNSSWIFSPIEPDNMSRQCSNTRCYTVGDMQNNTDKERSQGQAEAKPEVIKLGLDVHARQVTECRQLDGSTPRPPQKWDPWKLLNQAEEWVKAGVKVSTSYQSWPL